jgi:putative transposase
MGLIAEIQGISIRRQCELLEVSRSTVYYTPLGESPENLELMRILDERCLLHPTEGVLRIQDHLLTLQISANVKRIRRLLRLMGLMAIFPKRNLSKLGLAKYIRPYLLRGLLIDRPNQVWAIDITYIPVAKGFLYLTAAMDVYSRYVVAWDLHNSLDATHVLNVLKKAVSTHGHPEIINSDQGSQFTCSLWIEYLERSDIKISMDGKGRAIDNVFIERFWRTIKYDYVYLHPMNDGRAMYTGLRWYIDHYNHRAHQGIGRISPIELYKKSA